MSSPGTDHLLQRLTWYVQGDHNVHFGARNDSSRFAVRLSCLEIEDEVVPDRRDRPGWRDWLPAGLSGRFEPRVGSYAGEEIAREELQ